MAEPKVYRGDGFTMKDKSNTRPFKGKPVGGGKYQSGKQKTGRPRPTRFQRNQRSLRNTEKLRHSNRLNRIQTQASQRVQTQRALNTLALEKKGQAMDMQRSETSRRTFINAATQQQPVGPQVSQGTGTVGGAILRIFIALILFSVLYLVLVNSNQTSGLIKGVGTGLVGLSSDKTLFVKAKTG